MGWIEAILQNALEMSLLEHPPSSKVQGKRTSAPNWCFNFRLTEFGCIGVWSSTGIARDQVQEQASNKVSSKQLLLIFFFERMFPVVVVI